MPGQIGGAVVSDTPKERQRDAREDQAVLEQVGDAESVKVVR
jgi:hypothetical protein